MKAKKRRKQIPHPEHPGCIELAALGVILRASDLPNERAFDVMTRRAESLGFRMDTPAEGALLALSVMAATGTLPTDPPKIFNLARARAYRIQ